MKKLLLLALLTLGGCAELSQYATADSNASAKTKMRACLVSEANSRLQAGTLFANSISVTSEELVNVCLQKLALETAGISQESQSTASSIIQSLKNLGANN
jgi:hypothetical protein